MLGLDGAVESVDFADERRLDCAGGVFATQELLPHGLTNLQSSPRRCSSSTLSFSDRFLLLLAAEGSQMAVADEAALLFIPESEGEGLEA